MNFDPTSDESSLREQVRAAAETADEATLRTIVAVLKDLARNDLARETEVTYESSKEEPQVPYNLRKPSPEELTRILNERADMSKSMSREEAYKRIVEDLG